MNEPTADDETREVTVRGFVSPAGWDAEDNVTAVCIATYGDRLYYVNAEATKLFVPRYLRRSVEVTGRLRVRGGRNNILVSRIRDLGAPTTDPLDEED